MKKQNIILVLLFFTQLILCQGIFTNPEYYLKKVYVYSSHSNELKLNIVEKKYEVVRKCRYNNVIITSGKFVEKNNTIYCFEKNKIILALLKKDDYKLIVKNRSACFKFNETLYLKEIRGTQGAIETMNWKDGEKDGWWIFFSLSGIKSILYQNGAIKETRFETWQEIHSKPQEL